VASNKYQSDFDVDR